MTGRTWMTAWLVPAAVVLLGPWSSGLAQRPAAAARRAAACPAPDTTAEWFQKQRAWMDEREAKWSDPALRMSLLSVSGAGTASGALLGYEFVGGVSATNTPTDSALTANLLKLAAERGSTWPTRSVVGARGVLAVWTLAARDTALARAALKRMMEAGPDESPPAAVAILEDRQRLRMGRLQLYGTQLQRLPSGAVQPLPIEDPAHLALRRDGAGLPPLAQSLCAARQSLAPVSRR